MKLYRITPNEQVTTQWSGGSSTQLAIFPFESDFKERTFLFRISTATTETETSTFTSFRGYKRILMVIEGQLNIHHTGQYSKQLGPFETDRFEGSWETKAEGKVRDFNVIYSEDQINEVILEKRDLSQGETHLISLEKFDFAGVFIISGKAEAQGDVLKEKDFFLIERSLIENVFHVRAVENCTFLLVQIDLK
jgi:environmental stress-induced protein Ves